MDFRLRRRAHAAKRAAVKSALRANHLVAFAFFTAGFFHAVQTREFQQRFIRLSSAVAKKHPARPGVAGQPAREFALIWIPEKIAHVDEFAGLLLHGGDPVRMAMPERGDCDARGEIEITLPLIIPHLRAAAAHERDRCACVVFHHMRIVEIGGVRAEDGGRSHDGRYLRLMIDD